MIGNVWSIAVSDWDLFKAGVKANIEKIRALDGPKPLSFMALKLKVPLEDGTNCRFISWYANDHDRLAFRPTTAGMTSELGPGVSAMRKGDGPLVVVSRGPGSITPWEAGSPVLVFDCTFHTPERAGR